MTRLGDEFELRCSMWKFEVLRNAKLKEIAVAEAAEADTIIVAAHGAAALPVEVSTWIDDWLPVRGDHPAALIALVDVAFHRGDEPSAMQDYLRRVATVAKMDFLSQVTAFTVNDFPAPIFPLIPRSNAALPGDISRWNATERHWGINE
jgi:hypothetical protein